MWSDFTILPFSPATTLGIAQFIPSIEWNSFHVTHTRTRCISWYYLYLFSAGCPNSCSHHGSCIMQDNRYLCKCSNSWAGEDCSIRLETNCSDDIDNDDGEIFILIFIFMLILLSTNFASCILFSYTLHGCFYRYSIPTQSLPIFHPSSTSFLIIHATLVLYLPRPRCFLFPSLSFSPTLHTATTNTNDVEKKCPYFPLFQTWSPLLYCRRSIFSYLLPTTAHVEYIFQMLKAYDAAYHPNNSQSCARPLPKINQILDPPLYFPHMLHF